MPWWLSSNNPHWQDRYFFLRNAPNLPRLDIPVIWRKGVGTVESRPILNEAESYVAQKLWSFPVKDVTVLFSSELAAYL